MSDDASLPFAARVAAIATKHDKAPLFAPPLKQLLALTLITAPVDTDLLGTFTGEIPRAGMSVDAARRKARLAMEETATTIGLGSEGSFGPHPAIPFLAADFEVVVLIDIEHGVEVVETFLTADTNYAEITVDAVPIPTSFLERAEFPEHALVVSPADGEAPIHKGLSDTRSLDDAARRCITTTGSARIRADMRAHLNPTRQRAIAQLADKLARRLASGCPQCHAPGWGIVERRPGLTCEDCGTPTELTGVEIAACARQACGHVRSTPIAGFATAANCPQCNP